MIGTLCRRGLWIRGTAMMLAVVIAPLAFARNVSVKPGSFRGITTSGPKCESSLGSGACELHFDVVKKRGKEG